MKSPLRLTVQVTLLVLAGPLAVPCPAMQAGDTKVAEIRSLAEADAATALPALVAALGGADAQGRLVATLAIASIADRDPVEGASDDDGPDFAPAVAALLPLLEAKDPALVRAAATAVGAIGPVDDDDAVDDAVDALARAVPRAADAETRSAVLVAIADYGPAAEAAVPAVSRILRAKTAIEREAAAAALAAIGPEARAATGELARILSDEAALVRAAATSALAAIGPDARDASAPLARALADGDAMVRGGAARALAAIGPDAAGATGALVRAFADEQDADVRLGIIDAVGEIGPGAIQAAPTLVPALTSDDAETREAAISALGELGPQAAATVGDAVEKALADSDPFVRVAAVGALAGLGRQAPRARAILLGALASDDEDLQASAAEVIGDRGKAAAGFSQALAKVAGSAGDPHTRAAAITALGDIGATDQPAALGKALDDDDADVRHAAAWAINDLPETVAGLAKEIVAAADDDDVRVRMEIAPLLAALGTPDAKKALQALADDDDDNVADVAKAVLSGKGPASGR